MSETENQKITLEMAKEIEEKHYNNRIMNVEESFGKTLQIIWPVRTSFFIPYLSVIFYIEFKFTVHFFIFNIGLAYQLMIYLSDKSYIEDIIL